MKYLKLYKEYVFADIAKKQEWIELAPENRENLKKEIWELVDNAYSTLGGHVRIMKEDDVLNDKDLTFWTAVDIDQDPYCDVVIFGKKNQYGNKISGWGHDGSQLSKSELINKLINILSKKGFWIEVSGKPLNILLNKGLKYLNKLEDIQKLFPDSKINWLNDGKYTRELTNGVITEEEMVFGNPNF
jgi:ribosomal protein L28